jgi:transposase InsO family protein
MLACASATRVRLLCIAPGKPTQNAFVESFNGKFRECLNDNSSRRSPCTSGYRTGVSITTSSDPIDRSVSEPKTSLPPHVPNHSHSAYEK